MRFSLSLSAASLVLLAGTQAAAADVNIEKRQLEEATEQPHTSIYLTSYASEDIIPVTETVKVSTSTAATATALVLPPLPDGIEPQTEGIYISEIESSTKNFLMTSSIPTPTSLLQPLPTTSTTTTKKTGRRAAGGQGGPGVSPVHRLEKMQVSGDIFAAPVATSAWASTIGTRGDHPVPRKEVRKAGPIQTNKFYSNFFLGDQTGPTYTFPYSLAWSKGKGPAASWGIAVSHTEASQRQFGPATHNNANAYYINPVGIQSMILSATVLGSKTVLAIDQITAHSAHIFLKKDASAGAAMELYLVQGMAYVTGIFNGATPMIQSGVYFKSMTKVTTGLKADVVKYSFVLNDGTTWRVYGHANAGTPALDLKLVNNGLAQASRGFRGTVQIVKDPKQTGSEKMLDDGAGVYPRGVTLSGSVAGAVGTYSFKFGWAGHSKGNMYMYALPHHMASFDADTLRRAQTGVTLQTGTKGVATAVKGSRWTLTEGAMPTGMDWAPWDGGRRAARKTLSEAAKQAIRDVAAVEISQDMMEQINLDSMYFSGKAMLKFAQICYVLHDLTGDKGLALAGLAKLKEAFALFATNKQKFPLVYERAWGGVVSTATYRTGNMDADFGNSLYNDHHFHYGYHILAAAYIGYMDPAWAREAVNRDYVNTLVRDVANPSAADTYFPVWRNFDWYHGHSWAHGLYASLDGKNQESSSEDMTAAYALKMWGTVTGDAAMVARANLQLAITARSLQNYYLMTSKNTAHPRSFIGNKVAGILFENKVDHTTFFDSKIEAIQGIHMIPVHAPTGLSRTAEFVKEEWDAFFSNGRIDSIDNGWRGVIYASYATVAPREAWAFFNSTDLSGNWIDGGASQTWYMAYAAALGGV